MVFFHKVMVCCTGFVSPRTCWNAPAAPEQYEGGENRSASCDTAAESAAGAAASTQPTKCLEALDGRRPFAADVALLPAPLPAASVVSLGSAATSTLSSGPVSKAAPAARPALARSCSCLSSTEQRDIKELHTVVRAPTKPRQVGQSRMWRTERFSAQPRQIACSPGHCKIPILEREGKEEVDVELPVVLDEPSPRPPESTADDEAPATFLPGRYCCS